MKTYVLWLKTRTKGLLRDSEIHNTNSGNLDTVIVAR